MKAESLEVEDAEYSSGETSEGDIVEEEDDPSRKPSVPEQPDASPQASAEEGYMALPRSGIRLYLTFRGTAFVLFAKP